MRAYSSQIIAIHARAPQNQSRNKVLILPCPLDRADCVPVDVPWVAHMVNLDLCGQGAKDASHFDTAVVIVEGSVSGFNLDGNQWTLLKL
jgi:hypothetical protein